MEGREEGEEELSEAFKAEVENQLLVLKSSANDAQKQTAAQKVWMLSADKTREQESKKQIFVAQLGTPKALVQMLRTGKEEESRWRAAQALVQIAYSNETSCASIARTKVVKGCAEVLKDHDGATDRLKESALQLLNNVASNFWSCHEQIIEAEILNLLINILRSITVPDNLKRATVNLVYSLTFTEAGRTTLLDVDIVSSLVPIIRINKTPINSMCATLAAANLIGHRVRAQMLTGCGVVEKVLKSLEHALNRKPHGGQFNSLWKIAMALMELCKSDTHKETIVREGGVVLLTRLLDLSAERQHPKSLQYGCTSIWHLSFNGMGKAQLCAENVLCERLEQISLSDDHLASEQARGAMWQMGIMAKPSFSDANTHIFLSHDEIFRDRLLEIKGKLEAHKYVVWTHPPSGKNDEQMRVGVANCAVMCLCLSGKFHLSAQIRSEVTFAHDRNKLLVVMVVDDEGRETCWLNPFLENRKVVDFIDSEFDEQGISELIKIIGSRGKKIEPRDSHAPPTAASALSSMESQKSAIKAASRPEEEETLSKIVKPMSLVTSNRCQTQTGVSAVSTRGSPIAKEENQAIEGRDTANKIATPEAAAEVSRLLQSKRVSAEVFEAWTVEEVADWLEHTLVLGQYRKAFLDEGVDGQALHRLDDAALEDKLNVNNRLHRKKILTRIKQTLNERGPGIEK